MAFRVTSFLFETRFLNVLLCSLSVTFGKRGAAALASLAKTYGELFVLSLLRFTSAQKFTRE